MSGVRVSARVVKAWVLHNNGKPIRVFWSRLVAREEQRLRPGSTLDRCTVQFITASKVKAR